MSFSYPMSAINPFTSVYFPPPMCPVSLPPIPSSPHCLPLRQTFSPFSFSFSVFLYFFFLSDTVIYNHEFYFISFGCPGVVQSHLFKVSLSEWSFLYPNCILLIIVVSFLPWIHPLGPSLFFYLWLLLPYHFFFINHK